MTKSKNFIIPLVVYPFDVMVSLAEPDGVLEKTLGKYLVDADATWKWSNPTSTGRFCLFGSNQGLIRMKEYPTTNHHYAVLQHEIFHYVMNVLDVIGLKWCQKSDEAYSYLIGYLTREIYNRI